MSIEEIGLHALKESLGVTGMLRFLEQFEHGGSGDYTAEKYENEELDNIQYFHNKKGSFMTSDLLSVKKLRNTVKAST